MCRLVWPEARIFLCLWHVRKAWAENAIKKISTVGERATVLQMVGDIMYGKGMGINEDPVDWALQQLDRITTTRPRSAAFMKYMNHIWRSKASMWCVGARKIPHAGQNTNAAIESYHSNLKNILSSTKERFVGRRMDWLIYHLVGDVLTHYWYAVQCKAFGFVRNKKHEGIVCSAIIRASTIPDANVRICMDEDKAYVKSVNNSPKEWTIHSPDSEWAQCDCPIAREGMMCKHTVKVFKMLHPNIEDGVIVREAGTLHGVHRATPMAQCFSTLSQVQQRDEHYTQPTSAINVNEEPESVDLQAATIGAEYDNVILIESQESIQMVDRNSLCDVSNPIQLSQDEPRAFQAATQTTIHTVFTSLARTAETYPELHPYLLADLKHIRGKQTELIARGVAALHATPTTSSFPERGGDNSLKRHRGFIETLYPNKKKA